MLRSFILICFVCGVTWAAGPAKPSGLARLEICLNGAWDTVIDAGDDRIPTSGWSPRRAPHAPIATNPPASSIWYKRVIRIPHEWSKPDRRFFLKVEKAGHYAAVHWNGKLAGEHYGQYTPFETDVTSMLRPGEPNEIAIFVHNASGKYARPGVVLNDPLEGNAYRGATDQDYQRNWVGIAGDIFLKWRPAAHIAEVFAVTSVRKHELEARVETVGATGLTLQSAVLDRGKVVLRLPVKPIGPEGAFSVKAEWRDPILWGPARYGRPKLYTLRSELWSGGKVVDRRFTRFGFREVWIEGRDTLLNGKKLWMAGTYFGKLAPIRYLNDRRPQSQMLALMQASGLNTLHGHWDELGDTWIDRCDEAGVLVLGAFFCDGRPKIQSKADAGWADWMAETCRTWARATRNHPSIVMWRPADVLPQNVVARRDEFNARLAAQIREVDGTRPMADDSDIAGWAQSPLRNPQQPGAYDDASRMAERLASSSKPLLTKEIYTGFQDVAGLSRFFRIFYEKSYAGGSSGVIVQHLPLLQWKGGFKVEWLSDSGLGNRDVVPPGGLGNWSDSSQPAWISGPYSELFAELATKFEKQTPAPLNAGTSPELLISGLAPDDLAVLVPQDADSEEAAGVRAARDGTAWIVAPAAGAYRLYYAGGSRRVQAHSQTAPAKPGYDAVERVSIRR